MVVIFSASGDVASAHHSSRLFEPLMHWLFPGLAQARIEALHFGLRKCAHLAEFGLLAMLLWQALCHATRSGTRQWHWPHAGWALLLVALYAASDEIHQAFVPGRSGQVSDVIVDSIGGAIGLGVLWLAGKWGKRW
jgi:VanZ family protein